MRQKFNLNLQDLSRLAVLIYGAYGAGKTFLAGDFLKWASEKGPVHFINVKGEDGYMSLSSIGLGEVGETVENMGDFNAAIDECAKDKVVGLAIDTLPAVSNLVIRSLTGGELRYPDPKIDGERAKMMWGQIKLQTMAAVQRTRSAVPYVLWLSAYDKGEDANSGAVRVGPDLIGKQAGASAAWFDMVGQMRAQTVGVGKVKRWLQFAPDESMVVRQRLTNVITKDIILPEGGGGWATFFSVVEGAMKTKGSV